MARVKARSRAVRSRFSLWKLARVSTVTLGLCSLAVAALPLFLDKAERVVVAEMLYHEARGEPFLGRWALMSVVQNRRLDQRRNVFAHTDTLTEVIRDQRHGCQFSYFCDGRSDWVPPNRLGKRMLREAWLFQSVATLRLLPDLTGGALFYWNRHTATSDWFREQVESGRFQRSWWLSESMFGRHTFYRLGMERFGTSANAPISRDVPVDLRGSHDAVMQAWEYADERGYRFYESARQVWWWSWLPGQLQRIRESETVRLHQVDYPYLVPEVHQYLIRLAEQYYDDCGDALVVTSALRPSEMQNRLTNGSTRSVHPAGLAFDLRSQGGCQAWLETALILGERRGYVQVTQEFRPPHWHVVVYPSHYVAWRQSQN